MGLKMPGDEDVLTAKVLLMRAGAKSRAKSWLTESAEEETTERLDDNSKSSDAEIDGQFFIANSADENSGLGTPAKNVEDDLSQRQLLSANEALRRKLLSKNAYRKYNEGRQGGLESSKPKAKRVEDMEDDEEGKGRSLKRLKLDSGSNEAESDVQVDKMVSLKSTAASRVKKRPGSYLDELLANRKGKQKQTSKRKADDD